MKFQVLVNCHGARGRLASTRSSWQTLFNPFALWDFAKTGRCRQRPRKPDTSFTILVDLTNLLLEQFSFYFLPSRKYIQQVTDHPFQSEKSILVSTCSPYMWKRAEITDSLPVLSVAVSVQSLSLLTDWHDLERETRPTSFTVLKQIYQ